MRFALTGAQMRAVEDRVVAEGMAALGDLMQRAGTALAAEVAECTTPGPIVVVCGPGNNGGDGWVAARVLHGAGRTVCVLSLVAPESLRAEAAEAAGAALAAGVPFGVVGVDGTHSAFTDAAVVVDALFGIGFHGQMREPAAGVARAIARSGAYVVSADVPSGIDADTGVACEGAVCADTTVTFTAPKPGLLIYPGAACAGTVTVADVGIPESMVPAPGVLEVPDTADMLALMPHSRPDDHKGTRGRVAIVAGSRAYAGAAVLAAQGAIRMGVGYVTVVVPDGIANVLHTSLPGVIVRAVPATPDGSIARVDAVMSAVGDADVVVAGPGLTTAPGIGEVVHALVTGVRVPLVLDADALNALRGDDLRATREAPLVLTPHPGEAARLLRTGTAEVQADRVAAASALAGDARVCLLKGARSIVAGPDGRRALVLAGNAGLARAGSGDVLTGMLGGLLGRGVDPFDAALLAAHLHGRAAELGCARLTEMCFTSADIATFLPDAVREVECG
jgi:NAD(P)H-hydrate epimerase